MGYWYQDFKTPKIRCHRNSHIDWNFFALFETQIKAVLSIAYLLTLAVSWLKAGYYILASYKKDI